MKSEKTARRETRALLISIHSHYAQLILAGKKCVELRRRFTMDAAGRQMLIYATSPTAAVLGHVHIDAVEKLPTKQIWSLYGKNAAISADDFEKYYAGAKSGCAIILSNPTIYAKPVSLQELRDKHSLTAPQFYINLLDAHRELIEHEQD